MRDAYLDCERAWMSELPTLKMDLLDFRDIGDWLDLAEKIGLGGEMLDGSDKQFDGAAAALRYGGDERIGARMLNFDTKSGEGRIKIAREASRERVCQYGTIAALGGYLKKTKKR